jgi:hypothetical protein
MGTFKAGAAMSNITPPLGCKLAGGYWPRTAVDVFDELHAKAIAMTNGTTQMAIVVCDLIAITRDRCDAVKERAEKLCGIPAANILVAGTHTHSGPAPCDLLGVPPEKEYMDWAVLKIADAVALAHRRMKDAVAGAATGVVNQVFNRRWWLKDGTVKMNPGYQNPSLVRPAGPVDPQLSVLAIETPEREPITVLANYALHYVGAGSSTEICADYFAFFGRALRRAVGRDFVAIMSNGCSGDINNCDFSKPRHPQYSIPRGQTERVADICAAEALRVWRDKVQMSGDITLGVASREVEVFRKQVSKEDLEAAKVRAAKGDVGTADYLWAFEKVRVSELPDSFPTLLQAMRIGDVGIIGLPGEIFCEYGLQIKAFSPFKVTMPVALANGYLGYHPTDQALKEGSYETWTAMSSLPGPGTEGLYMKTARELFRALISV